MKIETVPGYYIHVTADNGKLLTNGDIVTKEIFAPLESNLLTWYEIDESVEEQTETL